MKTLFFCTSLVIFSLIQVDGVKSRDNNGSNNEDTTLCGETEKELNSPKCSGEGTFACGKCTCNTGYYGRTCECDAERMSPADADRMCRRSDSSEICEGRGKCICGICNCNVISSRSPYRRYTGRYCECDDYSCDYFNGQICGGARRGRCACGKCVCKPGYSGSSCQCPTSTESCRAKNGMICNGRGTCKCGRCTCNKDSYYRGATCEDCPTCPGRCESSKACVQCMAFGTGPMTSEECKAKCSHVTIVDKIQESAHQRICRFRDDDGCLFYFAYRYNSNLLQARRIMECPKPSQ